MRETAVRHWTKILETMAARNRARLSERAYIALMAALENGSDPRALRKLAIATATALGRIDGRLLSQPGDASSNQAQQEQSPTTKPAASATAPDTGIHSGARAPRVRTRRFPPPP